MLIKINKKWLIETKWNLNWNGQNLEDWVEFWPNIKGVMCNLAYFLDILLVNNFIFIYNIFMTSPVQP